MKYLSPLNSNRLSDRVFLVGRWWTLVFGLAWASAACANPTLYICLGPLFTNDLTPAQAKARGCAPAAQGRWSQAQGNPAQTMADTEPRPALAATPTSASAGTPLGTLPGTVLTPNSPASTSPPAAAAMPSSAVPLPATAATPGPRGSVAASAPATSPARRPTEPLADASRQRQRDSHAREIVLAELARTQARIQSLSAQPTSGPEAENALQRLRIDEDALRRELARRPG